MCSQQRSQVFTSPSPAALSHPPGRELPPHQNVFPADVSSCPIYCPRPKAENCRIRGSELIENMRLDEKFCLKFVTDLTWSTTRLVDGEGGCDARGEGAFITGS